MSTLGDGVLGSGVLSFPDASLGGGDLGAGTLGFPSIATTGRIVLIWIEALEMEIQLEASDRVLVTTSVLDQTPIQTDVLDGVTVELSVVEAI